MNGRGFLGLAIAAILFGAGIVHGVAAQSPPRPLQEEERREIERGLELLGRSLGEIRGRPASERADVSIFYKGLTWARGVSERPVSEKRGRKD